MGRFSDYDRMVAEFMRELGFTAIYRKTLEAISNDATGGVSLTTQDIEISCIRAELTRPLNGIGTNSGSSIQEGDLVLYVQPTEKADEFADALVVNAASDSVVISGETWAIVTAKLHATDPSDAILYELYIRK